MFSYTIFGTMCIHTVFRGIAGSGEVRPFAVSERGARRGGKGADTAHGHPFHAFVPSATDRTGQGTGSAMPHEARSVQAPDPWRRAGRPPKVPFTDGGESRSFPRDDSVLEPGIHPGPGRRTGGRADHARARILRSKVRSVRPALQGQAPLRRRQAWRRRSRHRNEPGSRWKARQWFSTGIRAQSVHSHLLIRF